MESAKLECVGKSDESELPRYARIGVATQFKGLGCKNLLTEISGLIFMKLACFVAVLLRYQSRVDGVVVIF
jgi:hypothetical protein